MDSIQVDTLSEPTIISVLDLLPRVSQLSLDIPVEQFLAFSHNRSGMFEQMIVIKIMCTQRILHAMKIYSCLHVIFSEVHSDKRWKVSCSVSIAGEQ